MKALVACAATVAVAITWPLSGYAQTSAARKVFIDADAEGLQVFKFMSLFN